MKRRSGREALARWLAERASTSEQRFVALEEALLSGRFTRYAFRRLAAFGLTRALAVFVHLVELTWLFEIFSAKPFVASIALQNVALVADAFFWGALERFRRRARELGPTSEAAALGGRWMTLASWTAIGVVALPVGIAAASTTESIDGWMLHAYAIVCGVRLGGDVLLRTYYSGVYAYHRVHRPLWFNFVGPVLVIAITTLLWGRAGGWSFVAALTVSVAVSRGLLFAFTNRAYRRFRVPRPRLRLFTRGSLGVVDRHALLGGFANLSSRVGGVVLLAALVPSLTDAVGPDDEMMIEPFAFALHLAAPFILIASQWAFVFYHDWKRVEREEASVLARLLERKLLVTGVLVGLACALLSATFVLLYIPWEEARQTLASLLVATLGLSLWTSLQQRQFSHGEHLKQAASAIALVAVVTAALLLDDLGVVTFYAVLAIGPWLAIGAHALLERFRRAPALGELSSIAAFRRALDRAEGAIVVWDAFVAARPAAVAARVCERLGTRGALVRVHERLVWFERAPHASRSDWLASCGGQLRSLRRIELSDEATHTKIASVLTPPDRRDVDQLASEHARLFPEGFVIRVGAPPPDRFLALPPQTRQAIWRDALRFRAGARGRSGWFVTCTTRDGAPDGVFVAPQPVAQERATAWRNAMRSVEWRLSSPTPAAPTAQRTSTERAA